jgi:hypothetical protein
MTHSKTMELTRGELGILLRGATAEWQHWYTRSEFRDAKEKDRVLTYQHQSWELVKKLQQAIKEMDNG